MSVNDPQPRVTQAELLELIYELLDAHDDTARLAAGLEDDLRWRLHLEYLRDLQRVGRGRLAAAAADANLDGLALDAVRTAVSRAMNHSR